MCEGLLSAVGVNGDTDREGPLSTHPSRSPIALGRSLKGHEDPFPPHWLNARFGFSQGTFAGTLGNGRDAPFADRRPYC